MSPAHPFILASASPRRRDLLAQADITPHQIIAPDIDETPHKGELPEQYVKRVAEEKARAVAVLHTDMPVLAADTVVAVGRRILGKPVDEKEAKRFLELLSGRRHRVYTAVHLVTPKEGTARCVMTQVQFKRLSEHDVGWYLESGEWEGRAGGYAIQGKAAVFVKAVHGSYTNVVGLPLMETVQLLSTMR